MPAYLRQHATTQCVCIVLTYIHTSLRDLQTKASCWFLHSPCPYTGHKYLELPGIQSAVHYSIYTLISIARSRINTQTSRPSKQLCLACFFSPTALQIPWGLGVGQQSCWIWSAACYNITIHYLFVYLFYFYLLIFGIQCDQKMPIGQIGLTT